MKKNKVVLKENRWRILYQVTEIYNKEQKNNTNCDMYVGYYVTNKSTKTKKAQAYRFKTINNNIETIEDNKAYEKALNCFNKGFSF